MKGDIGFTSAPCYEPSAWAARASRSLTLTAPRVIWYASAPPESAGVNIVQLPITGIVGKPTSGDPFLFALVNEVASYTWPT